MNNQNFQGANKSPGEVRAGLGSIHSLLSMSLKPKNVPKSEPKGTIVKADLVPKLSKMELLGGLGATTPKKLLIMN